MPPKRIVITGAPGTGKTVVIKGLENLGYPCYHEIIRDMTAEAKKVKTTQKQVSNPLVFVKDPMEFNQQLLFGRKQHYDHSQNIKEPMCFFDRGIPDVLAYMDFFGQEYPISFKTISRDCRYDHIFILPPWKSIYISDNERLESFEEAQELHKHLSATYKSLGYHTIQVPKAPIAERISFVLENMG
ncbi:MAG: ATP-binding protein [Bacteroidota bacterium]